MKQKHFMRFIDERAGGRCKPGAMKWNVPLPSHPPERESKYGGPGPPVIRR